MNRKGDSTRRLVLDTGPSSGEGVKILNVTVKKLGGFRDLSGICWHAR